MPTEKYRNPGAALSPTKYRQATIQATHILGKQTLARNKFLCFKSRIKTGVLKIKYKTYWTHECTDKSPMCMGKGRRQILQIISFGKDLG